VLFFLKGRVIVIVEALFGIPLRDGFFFERLQYAQVFLLRLTAGFASMLASWAFWITNLHNFIAFPYEARRHKRAATLQAVNLVQLLDSPSHLFLNACERFP
jgi:hypothetical protein